MALALLSPGPACVPERKKKHNNYEMLSPNETNLNFTRHSQRPQTTYPQVRVVIPEGSRIRRRWSPRRSRRARRDEMTRPHRRAYRWGWMAPDMERSTKMLHRRWWRWWREANGRHGPRVRVWPLHGGGIHLPSLGPARCLGLPRQQMLPMRPVLLHAPSYIYSTHFKRESVLNKSKIRSM
jgi:hypothetical protein